MHLISDAADLQGPADWLSENFTAKVVDSDKLIHTGSAADVFGAPEFDPAKVWKVDLSGRRRDSKIVVKMTPDRWVTYFVTASDRVRYSSGDSRTRLVSSAPRNVRSRARA